MRKVAVIDIEEIQEILLAFADGDLSKRLEISKERDDSDIIRAGINMIGEELEQSTVSKDYFKSIYNAISDVVIILDNHGEIANVNQAFLNVFPSFASSFKGMDPHIVFNMDAEIFGEYYSHLAKEDKSRLNFEHTIRSRGKKRKHFLMSLAPIHDKFHQVNGVLLIAKDITKERLLEEEKIKAILETEERERKRFAYDVHDALGQELNSVKMFLDVLMVMDRNTEEYEETLEMCRKLINGSIDTSRKLSYNIMPKSLEDGVLFSALGELVENSTDRFHIELSCPQNEFSLTQNQKINIFRIIQEFITNSVRHGNANVVKVKCSSDGENYSFELSDDGDGFNIQETAQGRGLNNIYSRLEVIGAEGGITSSIKKGTTLKFQIHEKKD